MRRVLDSPLLVILIGIGALAMFIPAVHARVLGDLVVFHGFLWSGLLFLVLTALLGVATSRYRPRSVVRSQFLSLIAAYAVLPLVLAVPVAEVVPDLRYLDAWFEMVSSFTTTGATVFDLPQQLHPSVHLWRGLVGWLGGFFILVAAMALLAPLNIGGFELLSGRRVGRGLPDGVQTGVRVDPSARLVSEVLRMAPVYAGLTGLLWLGLVALGARPLTGAMHAMATLSTSGISPVNGMGGAGTGGEALVLLFLVFALTRRTMPVPRGIHGGGLLNDPELRLGLGMILLVSVVLFLRHSLGAIEIAHGDDRAGAASAFWGIVFTVASFLTTTGFVADGWTEARSWSGLPAPGLILVGLVLIGGGVATTAGGLKLLRVYALHAQARRELERLLHPSSVAGGGRRARQLRREGAHAAWLFLMLFAITSALVISALTLTGLNFETALVFSVAALSTTGPLVSVATELPLSWALLGDPAKLLLGGAMVLGRLEMLMILALLIPDISRN